MTSVLILALLLAQQTAPPEKATLSGTVVDSITGLPLGKASVIARHVSGQDPGASTTTDARGNFLLVDIDAGQYRLAVRRNGYLDTYFGAKQVGDGFGSTITLTSGQRLQGLQVKLMPFGVIAGTVRDADGEPVAGAAVEIYASSYQAGRRRIQSISGPITTDDLGQYHMVAIPPGRYYASARMRRGYGDEVTVDHSAKSKTLPEIPVTTFYPGTLDPSGARAIDVAPGGRATGIDIAIIRSPLYKVSVHVDAPTGFRGGAALQYAIEGFGWIGNSRNINPQDVEINGVPPGSYILRFGASMPQKPIDGADDGVPDGCGSSTPLTVKQGDVEGPRVALGRCAELIGHVTRDDGKPLRRDGVSGFVGYDGSGDNRVIRDDNTFRLTVSAGSHTLDFSNMIKANGLYIKSVRSGNQDFLRNVIILADSEHLDLEVVLAADGGSVDGIVTDSDSKPVPGARVVLISNETALRSRPDYTPSVTANEAGHFEIKNVAPGDYKLFAWEDIERDSWFDPDVLKDFEARGQAVSVKAKDNQTANLTVLR